MKKPAENQKILENSENAIELTREEISLGRILKEKRQNLKMDIAEISSYLKIKSNDIDAIESDDLGRITAHLYVLGLIRAYARFLKIDPKTIEEKIRLLPIKSNVENRKHQLLNIGENNDLSPDKDSFFNFLLISILLFLTLLLIYNSNAKKGSLITGQDLIQKLENIDSENSGY